MDTFILSEPVKVRSLQTDIQMDIAVLQQELDDYYKEMLGFPNVDSSTVFMRIAGYSARASWIRSKINRQVENRVWTKFLSSQIEPFIAECDRQFRVWSRNFSVSTQEWNISKGY